MMSDRQGSASYTHARRRIACLRFYRIALAISLAVNVLLITVIWAYIHFAGLLSIIQEVVGVFG